MLPGQTSKSAGISATTLRRYVNKFGHHLSHTARRGRGRRFTESDLYLISQIKQMYTEGRTDSEIDASLATVDFDEARSSELAKLAPAWIAEPLTEALETSRSVKSQVEKQQEDFETYKKQQEQDSAEYRRNTAWILWAMGIAIAMLIYLSIRGGL